MSRRPEGHGIRRSGAVVLSCHARPFVRFLRRRGASGKRAERREQCGLPASLPSLSNARSDALDGGAGYGNHRRPGDGVIRDKRSDQDQTHRMTPSSAGTPMSHEQRAESVAFVHPRVPSVERESAVHDDLAGQSEGGLRDTLAAGGYWHSQALFHQAGWRVDRPRLFSEATLDSAAARLALAARAL